MSSDEEELKNGHEVDDVEDSQSSEGSLEDEEEAVNEDEKDSFEELGLSEPLCEACERVGWKAPTKVQIAAIPPALSGKDVIALAETGSGKTGAFALPILQNLMQNPQRNYALILSPTRELAIQIAEHFSALGTCIGLSVAVIVGGVDMATQAISLAKRPHVIVATPGRLVDHLENTKGFHLRSLKYLVMDEADRILNMDFEAELEKILKAVPKQRNTFLFSATMTKKVSKLERASLKDPVKVEISSSKYQTVDRLKQYYVFIPLKYKEAYLVHILNEKAGNSVIIFCATCASVMKTAFMLRHLGFTSIALHGQMNQPARIGLDIANVDVVINYDVPTNSKDYVHRVGRTARAGKSGTSITIITQYDVEVYQSVESNLGTKLPEYPIRNEDVMPLVEHVSQAIRFASQKYKETNESSGKRSARGGDKEQKGRKSRRH
ncbi:RNA helicase [Aphelenchoides besseyi]|nr:RNA helicase [Aphelenchoides besseyi]